MSELKLSPENQMVDVPYLNRFRIGDHVVADACEDFDHHEGIIVGIEFQRFYGSDLLVPSITLLHDGYLTDGFKPQHLRKVEEQSHSEKLRHGLENVAASLSSRPPELRGPFVSSATTPTASELVEALRGTFCVLFLDGRNEHGSHVLPSFPTSIDLDEVDLAEQAESILREAESLGFVVGEDHVWAEFTWVEPQIGDEGRIELDGYYDFKRINVVMTRAALSNIGEAT